MSLQRQVMVKMMGKREPEQEKEALEWIFTVLGEPVPHGDFGDILRDGQVLCRLLPGKPGNASLPPVKENKREFSEEVLAASKTVIGLQAGSNKGATASGQNVGAQRRVNHRQVSLEQRHRREECLLRHL
nr:muscle-specific protein 20-like [Cherax quadricarinatus]